MAAMAGNLFRSADSWDQTYQGFHLVIHWELFFWVRKTLRESIHLVKKDIFFSAFFFCPIEIQNQIFKT